MCIYYRLFTLSDWVFSLNLSQLFYIFLKIFIYYFQREGKERRKGEKEKCVVASLMPPTGDLACDPGMSPDWEGNWWPSGVQAGTQSTEPQQPVHNYFWLTTRSEYTMKGFYCASYRVLYLSAYNKNKQKKGKGDQWTCIKNTWIKRKK